MKRKQIRIEITESGEIRAKTLGMNDETCLDYVEVLERMLDAKAVESEFTEEYLRAHTQITTSIKEQQEIKRE